MHGYLRMILPVVAGFCRAIATARARIDVGRSLPVTVQASTGRRAACLARLTRSALTELHLLAQLDHVAIRIADEQRRAVAEPHRTAGDRDRQSPELFDRVLQR